MSESTLTDSKGTIFGREPAVLIGMVASLLAVAIGFLPDALTVEQAGGIIAFLTAATSAWMAFKVRPIAPSVFTGVITTGATLLGAFGLHLTQEQVGSLAAASVAILTALVVRPQSTPAADPRTLDGAVVAGDVRAADVRPFRRAV